MILSDKDLKLTEDQQGKINLLATLNKSLLFYEREFYHHAERLRASMENLKTIEMSKKQLFGEGK